jgi:hypothetical protein
MSNVDGLQRAILDMHWQEAYAVEGSVDAPYVWCNYILISLQNATYGMSVRQNHSGSLPWNLCYILHSRPGQPLAIFNAVGKIFDWWYNFVFIPHNVNSVSGQLWEDVWYLPGMAVVCTYEVQNYLSHKNYSWVLNRYWNK